MVPRCVTVGRQADDRAVVEHVVLAVDQPQFVAEVEVAWIVAVERRGVGIHAGVPFASPHQRRRVRDQRVEGVVVDMGEEPVALEPAHIRKFSVVDRDPGGACCGVKPGMMTS
jgi:hypothetical protein